MNYSKIYSDFIADRRLKESAISGYSEKHHIVPRSLGGGNEKNNIIRLSAEDHIHAHILLAKIHGGKMWAAVMFIFGHQKTRNIPSREEIRESAFARMMNAKMQTGELGNFYGKTHSKETIESMSGLNHFKADRTVYEFENVDGRNDNLTRVELCKKYKIPNARIMPLFQKYKHPVRGWFRPDIMDKSTFGHDTGNMHDQADTKIYNFEHVDGSTFIGTRHDLTNMLGVKQNSAAKLIQGKRKSYKGWFLPERHDASEVGVFNTGVNCPISDLKNYKFINGDEVFHGNKFDFSKKYGIPLSSAANLTYGITKISRSGWSIA